MSVEPVTIAVTALVSTGQSVNDKVILCQPDAEPKLLQIARIKIPEINVSFFGLNSAGFSDYPTINSDSDIDGTESCCE